MKIQLKRILKALDDQSDTEEGGDRTRRVKKREVEIWGMGHEASRRSLVASLTEAGQSNYNALQKILPLNYVSYAMLQ